MKRGLLVVGPAWFPTSLKILFVACVDNEVGRKWLGQGFLRVSAGTLFRHQAVSGAA
jgi:hypothetical protein